MIALGTMCFAMIRPLLAPSSREACTYSRLRTSSTEERMKRTPPGHANRDSAKITVHTLRSLNSCSTTIAARMNGRPKAISHTREITASTQPPKYPATAPTSAAMLKAMAETTMPTRIEARAPYMTLV
ncbi:hypothetical protein D3C74_377410 [compost metagenome]